MNEHRDITSTVLSAPRATLLRRIEPLQQPDHRRSSVSTWKAEVMAGCVLVVAAKQLAPKRLANELAVAWIARQLSVSCPAAFVVDDPHGEWPEHDHLDDGTTLFGSQFVDLPHAQQRNYGEKLEFAASKAFADTFLLDLLVDNIDRVGRNLLCGPDSYFAIDHDKSFGGENWTSETLANPEASRPPTYLESELLFAAGVKGKLIAQAQAWSAASLDLSGLQTLCDWLSDQDVDALCTFVEGRLNVLPKLLTEAFARSGG